MFWSHIPCLAEKALAVRTQVPTYDLSDSCISALHNDDCLPKLERSYPRRPSSPRRLSPLCPRTRRAYRIYIPHDLRVASTCYITLWIVCLCVNHVYSRIQDVCLLIINILLCIWRVSVLSYMKLVWILSQPILKDLLLQDNTIFCADTKICTRVDIQDLQTVVGWRGSGIQYSVSMQPPFMEIIHTPHCKYTRVSILVYLRKWHWSSNIASTVQFALLKSWPQWFTVQYIVSLHTHLM